MPMTDVTTQCHVVRCCVTVTWPKTITVTAECKHWRPTSVCRGRTPGHDLLPPDGPGEPAAGAGDQLEQLDQLELEREPAGCGGVVSTQGPALLATAAAAQGWSSLAPCCRDVTRYLHYRYLHYRYLLTRYLLSTTDAQHHYCGAHIYHTHTLALSTSLDIYTETMPMISQSPRLVLTDILEIENWQIYTTYQNQF